MSTFRPLPSSSGSVSGEPLKIVIDLVPSETEPTPGNLMTQAVFLRILREAGERALDRLVEAYREDSHGFY